MNNWQQNDQCKALSEQVYFEFIPIGRAVKVVAMCSVTGEEAAIVGDARAMQSHLQNLALKRLSRKIETSRLPTSQLPKHLTSSSYH